MAKQRDIIQSVVQTIIAGLPPTGGESAYEIAVRLGFTGTEQEWCNSLHGTDGYIPIKGIDYTDGINGRDGVDGNDATVTKSAVETVLTGEINSHTHAGGSGGLTQSQIRRRIC